MYCPNCGKECNNGRCPNGCYIPNITKSKSIHQKWWFWVLMGLATFITIILGIMSEETDQSYTGESDSILSSDVSIVASINENTVETKYEVVDLQEMLDELDKNALRAEQVYNNKYIEITGKISVIDSDGSYISIEPVDAETWNFDSVMCKLKNKSQRDFIIQKNVDDTVTVRGKVISVGEVLGYTVSVESIS